MSQNVENNKEVPVANAATQEADPYANASWYEYPGIWVSETSKNLKRKAVGMAIETAGEQFGVNKEFTTGIVGMINGTNQADGLMGLFGQAAVRGGAYWAASAAIANVLKYVSGGNLDLTGALPIIIAVGGALITGLKQYNANSENINKDVAEKTAAVKEVASNTLESVKEQASEFINNTGLAENETVKQVAGFAGVNLDKVNGKLDVMVSEDGKSQNQPKLNGPSPM